MGRQGDGRPGLAQQRTRVRAGSEQTWPSVSAIVATRDRPELLQRAVRSILAQDYPGEIEVVVVFDQSSPAALPAPTVSGRAVRVLVNDRTPGLAGARNTGIVGSAGDLIAFCDDDDEWDQRKLSLQVDRLRSGAGGLVAAGVRVHFGDREVIRLPAPTISRSRLIMDREFALHPSSFLIERGVLIDQVGLVDEQIPGSYGEDYDFLLRAASVSPVSSVTEPLVEVYWHAQSFYSQRWQMIVDALQYLMDKHPDIWASKRGAGRILGQIAFSQAALGHRWAAVKSGWLAMRRNPAERRAYLALAVASGALSASAVMRLANSRGRGI